MSRTGKPGLRGKIFAVLASLVALWAFAAYVTIGEGVNLVWLATLEQQVGKPTEALVAALQQERRVTVEFVAGQEARPGVDRSGMDAARRVTDQAIERQRRALEGTAAQWSTSEASDARLADLLAGVGTLQARRADIDAGHVDRISASQYFTDLVQRGHDVYDTYAAWDDSDVIFQAATVLLLTHSQEMISREDVLLAGVIAADRFTEADRRAFVELVGAQRYLSRQIAERLPEPDRSEYAQMLTGTVMLALRGLEDSIALAPAGRAPVTDAARWQATTSAAIDALRGLVLLFADRTVERVRPAAIWILIRFVLAAGLGLIAVIASIRFTIRSLRTLQDQLARLRVTALDLAHRRLPRVVEQLRRGEEVDVRSAAPPLDFGSDDIGLVGRAFNTVQETAIRATVDQAQLRRGVRDIFLSLAHRIQALVHRQLKLIDSMERQAVTDEELADLYRIDHLATRMRRNAENLIVLAGMPAGRSWRGPVAMVDVVRAALAEVEDYQRVKLVEAEPATLDGRAAGDVIHLLAELMENAASFSPPRTAVSVIGSSVHNGYVVEIEDRGLGMSPEDLEAANRQIADPPEFQLSSTARLGFFVVGRLAQRYGIRVHLSRSRFHGVTATVLIPNAHLGQSPPDHRPDQTPAVATVAARAVPTLAEPTPQEFTPAGLPLRARRAKQVTASEEAPQSNGRTPEEVGRVVAMYAAAARQGRTDAERQDT